MNLGYMLHGGAPVKKRFRVNATMTTAVGMPVMIGASGNAGLVLTSAISGTDVVGVTLDTGVYTTTPTATTPEGIVTVVINPDAVYRIRGASTSTAGAQLSLTTNATASSGGTVVTSGAGDPDPSTPHDMIEGMIVCVSGANKGQMRTLTTTATTSATTTVAFLNAIAVGDEFIILPWSNTSILANTIKLTTNFAEAVQSTASGVGILMAIPDLEIDFADTTSARRNSYVYAKFLDHVYDVSTI